MAIVYYHHYQPKVDSDILKRSGVDDNFQSDNTKYDSELVDFTVSCEPPAADYSDTDHYADRIFWGKGERSAFYVAAIGHERPWLERIVQSKHVDRYIIHFVFEGCGYFNSMPVSRGQAFIGLPNEKISLINDPKDPIRLGWISVCGSDLEDQIKLLSLPISPIINVTNIEKVEKIIKNAVYSSKYDVSPQNMQSLLISKLFRVISLLDFEVHVKQSESSAHTRYIENVKNYVNAHYSCNITVSDLAEHAGVSVSYLRQIFTSHFGMSPQEVIIQKRMSVAKKLLKETDAPISAIAQSCGYADHSAFCKVFKKTQEISPLQYRKQTKPNE